MIEAAIIFSASSYSFCAGVWLMGCRTAKMSWPKSGISAVGWPIALIGEILKGKAK